MLWYGCARNSQAREYDDEGAIEAKRHVISGVGAKDECPHVV